MVRSYPAKWEAFRKRYWAELENNSNIVRLQELTRNGDVTFVYASKDTEHNAAVVLKEYLELSRLDV